MKSTLPYSNEGFPTFQWMEVTPEVAEKWLSERNIHNRNKRPVHIDALVRDMRSGNFKVTGDTIRFDKNGVLIDGQHRLSAVVASGVTIWTGVLTDLDPDVKIVIDANAKRSARDALFYDGIERYRTIVAGMANISIMRERGGMQDSLASSGGASFTNSEVVAWVEKNPGAIEAAELAAATHKAIGCRPSILAYAVMELMAIDEGRAREFLLSTAEMRTGGPGDPRYAMVRAFERMDRIRDASLNSAMLYVIFRAWNGWRLGETVHKITPVKKYDDQKRPEEGRAIPEPK